MTYAKAIVLLIVVLLTGCSSESFSVAVIISDASDSASDEPDTGLKEHDAGDSAPVVCDLYSCKPGCFCEEGTKCGIGGLFTCGSVNCVFFLVDAQSYNCPSELDAVYKCSHFFDDANSPDRLSRCQFKSGTTAEGDSTYWCCPKN